MQISCLTLFRGRCLASFFAIALIAATTSVATPFPASSFEPVMYKRSASLNATYPLGRSLQRNTRSADQTRAFLPSVHQKRDLGTFDLYLNYLFGSSQLKSLGECSSKCEDTEAFRDQCASSGSSVGVILQGFSKSFSPMADRYGLKNYNKDDLVQTQLKGVIDLVKDLLAYIAKLVKCSPLLSVALYPVVYQVKCIIIDILNILQNCVDADLNELHRLLAACSCGIELAGLCPDFVPDLMVLVKGDIV